MNEALIHHKIDWRLVSVGLVVAAAIMLAFWRPWQAPTSTKTITVQGEASVSHTPDLFSFQPVFTDTDLAKVSVTGNAAVAKLKQLGVKASDLKTDAASSQSGPAPMMGSNGTTSQPGMPIRTNNGATYTITFNVGSQALAQSVTDYLATTSATGIITPESSLSTATKTKLDLEARRQAGDNAKQKAEALAGQLGAKVGKVVKITDDTSQAITPMSAAGEAAKTSATSPIIEPGTDAVEYSFTVVFELK